VLLHGASRAREPSARIAVKINTICTTPELNGEHASEVSRKWRPWRDIMNCIPCIQSGGHAV